MKNKLLFGFLILIFSSAVLAQFTNTTFWRKRQPYLRFTTAPQSVFRLNCSGLVTVQAVSASTVAANQPTDLTVTLSATGLTYYTDANCSTQITNATIPAGSSSTSFYFVASGTGTSELTASAAPYKDAVQVETSSANPYIWTGGGANANWNTGLNWSGGAAPGSGNRAVFDGSCVSNCSPNITVNTSILAVRVLAGYTGTITQNASQILTVGSAGWFHEAGTFAGGNNTVTIDGPFTVSGGTYTSTSTTTVLNSHFIINGGTFTPGATYNFNDRGAITPGSAAFNNVSFTPGNGSTYTLTGTLLVNGNLSLNNTTNNCILRGGIVDLKGNLTIVNSGLPGSTEIRLTGAGTQTIDASGGNTTNRNLPSLTIASTGPVNLVGKLNIQGNYNYVSSGTFNAGTSFINFIGFGNNQTATFGSPDYYDVGWYSNHNLTLTTDVKVTRNFTIEGLINNAGYISGPGKVYLSGDLAIRDYGVGQYGNLVVRFVGNNVQNVTVVSSSNPRSPGFEVATNGTVNFPATMSLHHNFVYTSGTITGLSSVSFIGISGASHTIDAAGYSFNNVTFSGANGNYYNITGVMNIAGNLHFNSSNNSILNGTINLGGNVTFTSFYANNSNITFNGTGDQTVTHAGSGVDGTMTVNKSSGTLRYLTSADWRFCPFILTAGTVDINGFTVRYESAALNGNTITKNGGTLIVGGATVGNGSLYGGTIMP